MSAGRIACIAIIVYTIGAEMEWAELRQTIEIAAASIAMLGLVVRR